jgi:hypothetical protein
MLPKQNFNFTPQKMHFKPSNCVYCSEFQGLFTLVEEVDDKLLARAFSTTDEQEGEGPLYKEVQLRSPQGLSADYFKGLREVPLGV